MIVDNKANEQKIKNNAIIAYLFIFANILFLFSKNNVFLNNDFVKSHTKTAILIHAWFLVNTVVFAYFWLGLSGKFIGYSLSDIIAIVIYLPLFTLMVIWIYKAYNNEIFKLWETIKYNQKSKKLLDITLDGGFSEKDKITIILSKIPFIWFLIYPKYKQNKLIWNNTKINLYTTILIISLYIFWNPNLANLLLLFYIIFIVFISINLFIKNEVINISANKIPNVYEILIYVKTFKVYIWNYFSSKKDFLEFEELLKQIQAKENKAQELENKKLDKLKQFKLPKYIIYTPILNLICLFDINSKQKFHIINWVMISIIFIVLASFYSIDNKYQLFIFIPLVFAIWNLNAKIMNYKIPFLYDIYEFFIWIKNYLLEIIDKIKKIKNTKKEVKLKVADKDKKS